MPRVGDRGSGAHDTIIDTHTRTQHIALIVLRASSGFFQYPFQPPVPPGPQEARQHYESALVELQRADAAGSYSLRLLERLEGAYHSALDQYGEVEVELAAAK